VLFKNIKKTAPNEATNATLGSLNYAKNFENRVLCERSKTINQVFKDLDNIDKFLNPALSCGSLSLFIFLPFFTLFLKLFYIRKKYTYVNHLNFVFHTQTVFL
jgi:ABC-type protease/lipase transport system fused ATPase/permease subunit